MEIICKLISVIQRGASTRNLLHSAVFGIRTVDDQILQFLCSKSHKKHFINKHQVIINKINTNKIEEKKKNKSLNIIELKILI